MLRLLIAILVLLLASIAVAAEPLRLHSRPTRELISWLYYPDAPKSVQDEFDLVPLRVCDELQTRNVDRLLDALRSEKNPVIRQTLVTSVFYQMKHRRITETFSRLLSEKEDEESYYIANYLAKNGDERALATLNRHAWQYPVSSAQWACTLELFGKYLYRPAAATLLDSLDAASLNAVFAAEKALHRLYPDAPEGFSSLSAARQYFQSRVKGVAATLPADAADDD